MLCDLEILYQVVKAADFLPRESVLNSRELAFGRGIESVFCKSICVHISVYVYVLTSKPYMVLCSWSQEKKKQNEQSALKVMEGAGNLVGFFMSRTAVKAHVKF